MARGRKDEMYLNGMSASKAHGDLGYVGEKVKNDSGYDKASGCVDSYLMSDVVPSFVESVKCSVRNDRQADIFAGDMPRGPMAKQQGPSFKKADSADMGRRPGKARKGEY